MAAPDVELARLGNAPSRDGSDAPALRIGRLYEQHFRMVRALCQVLLRNPVDAEDAAQQTFLSAFGSLINGTVPELPAFWLATIARRECWARTAQRRRQPLALDETNTPASAADSPLDEAIRNADLTALWQAINDLPRQQRRAFLMREFSGLSYAEVAEALGASESAIESLLVRARRRLRDGLEPALRAANLIGTPIILLQHRLARLLGAPKATAGAAATAGIPAAAKLGATAAAVVVAGSAAVGVSVGVGAAGLHHRTGLHRASVDLSGQIPGSDARTGSSALDRPLGRSAARRLFPLVGSWNSLGSPARAAGGHAGRTAGATTAAGPGQTTARSGEAGPAGGGDAPVSGASSDPITPPLGDSPGTTDTTPTDTAPTDTAPADTTPTDTAPADTTPTDTTPLSDSGPPSDTTAAVPE